MTPAFNTTSFKYCIGGYTLESVITSVPLPWREGGEVCYASPVLHILRLWSYMPLIPKNTPAVAQVWNFQQLLLIGYSEATSRTGH